MQTGHPIFWILVAAVLAPLLAAIPRRFKVPVVVLEVLLGILIGPQVLGLVQFEGSVTFIYVIGRAMTLFMAGMELDLSGMKGRPISLAVGGWGFSALLGICVIGLLHVIPQVHAPMMVTLALCTTGLGTLLPIFRDSGQLSTPFGRMLMAAGTLGEVGPIVAMSLLLSQQYSTWQEIGFLLAFLAIVGGAILVGMGAHPSRPAAFLSKHMHTSTQLPVRVSLLMLAALLVLSEDFGFESIFGAFAAGLIVGQFTRGEAGKAFREKIDAVSFGWFYPFFFVGTGIKFDVAALGQSLTTMLVVPAFMLLFLVIRGAPAFLYRNDITKAQFLPFALASAVPSLSIIVVITDIGVKAKTMNPDIATAMIGAALLCIMVFPTITGMLLSRQAVSSDPPTRL